MGVRGSRGLEDCHRSACGTSSSYPRVTTATQLTMWCISVHCIVLMAKQTDIKAVQCSFCISMQLREGFKNQSHGKFPLNGYPLPPLQISPGVKYCPKEPINCIDPFCPIEFIVETQYQRCNKQLRESNKQLQAEKPVPNEIWK